MGVVGLSLGADCCPGFAEPLLSQLRSYNPCSVLPVPESLEAWRSSHRTARKRAGRAERLGYHFSEIRRELYVDDMWAINTSLPERQGKPMSAGYLARPSPSPLPDYPCSRHAVYTYGVLLEDTLVAYLSLYRSGELALVSSILGHGEHLRNDVMYGLFQGVVAAQAGLGGALVYNLADSGTDGLRYFKSKLGFSAMEVSWKP